MKEATEIESAAKMKDVNDAARSCILNLNNFTPTVLIRQSWTLLSGQWDVLPPEVIGDGLSQQGFSGTWATESDGLCEGTEGSVTYVMDDAATTMTMYWGNFYFQTSNYFILVEGPMGAKYTAGYNVSGDDNATVFYVLAPSTDMS